MITDNQRAYLAGIFDGEGCFSITVSKRHNTTTWEWKAVAVISQSEKRAWILKTYQSKTGLGSITSNSKKKIYQWRINGPHVDQFIDLIYDHIEAKREQANIVRRFRSTFYKQGGNSGRNTLNPTTAKVREMCREQLHNLNDHAHVPLVSQPHQIDPKKVVKQLSFFNDE